VGYITEKRVVPFNKSMNSGQESIPATFNFINNETYYKGKKYRQHAICEAGYVDILEYFRNYKQGSFGTSKNAKEIDDQLFDKSNNNWKGGSYEDLYVPAKDIDLSHISSKLEASEVFSKLVYSLATVSKRTRIRCAYDGELDYDKRFDVEPFNRRSTRKGPQRILKLRAQGNFTCYVSSQVINEYGQFIAVLINLLEKNQVMVQFDLMYQTSNVADADDLSSIYLKVKKADEYLSMASVSKVVSSNFFRRIGFALYCCNAEIQKRDVGYGLGQSVQHNKTWEIEGDTLNIYSVPTWLEQMDIVSKLHEVFGKGEERGG